MRPLSLPNLVLRRFADDWSLLASIFVGIIVATTLAAAAPVYVKSLERLGLNLEIDRLERPFSNISVFASNILLTEEKLRQTDNMLDEAIEDNIAPIYERRVRFLVVDTFRAGLPGWPLPLPRTSPGRCCRAYFRHLTDLDQNVTFIEGRMAGSEILQGRNGPLVEAVISTVAADLFGLAVGDVIDVTPAIGESARIDVRIAGIMFATDPFDDYWAMPATLLLDPPPPEEEEGLGDTPVEPEAPPVPLFTTQQVLTEGVGRTYPFSLVESVWILLTDTEQYKKWSLAEARDHFTSFEIDLARSMPGLSMSSRLRQILGQFERKAFFSRIPLLLLLAITLVSVLFYLVMIVSYLVHSRSQDSAMLRSRGIGTSQLLRLYFLEGFLMTAAAVSLAPFVALGAVAVAGKVLYLRDMTGGEFLPVELEAMPFYVAGAIGLLCLAIVVLPGVLGARGGILGHRLRSGRPPALPLLHRYNIDIALLVLGGVTYWELQSRGHLISGGLLSQPGVNETLLLAPVLFLVVVALVFMRFFPLVVRFASGDSPALLHLGAAAAVISTTAIVTVTGLREGGGLGWLMPVALASAAGGIYWTTARARAQRSRIAGLVLQSALIGGFVYLEPPDSSQLLFLPTIGLIGMVPAQIAFILLRGVSRAAPVWLSMGFWHMARNPLQYAWLMLLLVLVTGVGILSTTVGGTLERNQEDRIKYSTATDVRIANVQTLRGRTLQAVKEPYLHIPGVTDATVAFRADSSVAAVTAQLLALESREFPYMTWYRDDFSLSLGGVMTAITTHPRVEKVVIPEGATTIGFWVNPTEEIPNLSMWMLIETGGGVLMLPAGILGPPGWQLMTAEIPRRVRHPINLVSVQISEPGVGNIQTAGQILIDDIHVSVGPEQRIQVLESFEGQRRWMPIITSTLIPDRITSTARDSHGGARAGVFTFGEENQEGIRGFYQSPTGGPLPVVVSTAFAEETSLDVGSSIIASVSGRSVPMVINDTVDYFPTMSPSGQRFILTDLDNLMGHVNFMGHLRSIAPNELFISGSPEAYSTFRDSLDNIFRFTGRVYDRTGLLESSRLDPLATSGWNSMVLLALVIVVLTAGLGYSTYLLLFASKSSAEIGFLESLGLSGRQMLRLLAFEHLAIAAIGIGLGTWAGFQTARLMVSAVAITETGDRAVPPFVLITDWGLMLPTYGALVAIFVVAVAILHSSAGRQDLHAIARLTDG